MRIVFKESGAERRRREAAEALARRPRWVAAPDDDDRLAWFDGDRVTKRTRSRVVDELERSNDLALSLMREVVAIKTRLQFFVVLAVVGLGLGIVSVVAVISS